MKDSKHHSLFIKPYWFFFRKASKVSMVFLRIVDEMILLRTVGTKSGRVSWTSCVSFFGMRNKVEMPNRVPPCYKSTNTLNQ